LSDKFGVAGLGSFDGQARVRICTVQIRAGRLQRSLASIDGSGYAAALGYLGSKAASGAYQGDTVVVWKLDRLSRSLKDVLHIMERIAEAGVGFRSVTENIDTTTPAGRMMMQMLGSFAEFERAMIRERTSAGLAVARAEGRVGGRRKKLDKRKRLEIAESVINGRKSGADMARLYNVSQPTVSRIVAQHRMQLEGR